MSARDRTAVLAMLENAQWVYSLGRYPRKQVLDDPVDVRMLRERIAAMRKAAGELSAAQKKKIEIPWARLEEDPDETPEMLWAVTKKVTSLGGKVLMPAMEIAKVGRFSVVQDPTGAAFSPFRSARV